MQASTDREWLMFAPEWDATTCKGAPSCQAPVRCLAQALPCVQQMHIYVGAIWPWPCQSTAWRGSACLLATEQGTVLLHEAMQAVADFSNIKVMILIHNLQLQASACSPITYL